MRRRQRRLRSWWRHEQRSVAAALAAATHHSAPRSGWPEQHNAPQGPTTASAMEEKVREMYDGDLLRESGLLPEVAGPQAAVTVGCVAAEAPSLVVPPVAEHDGLDDATIQYLLQQSLLARAEEEMVAKEQAELELLVKEGQLLAELRRDRDDAVRVTRETWSSLSCVERTAVVWFVAKEKVTKWKEKKEKERGGGEGRGPT